MEQARAVAGEVVGDASELTSGEVRARVSKLAMATDADAAKKRMEHAHEGRRVVVEPNVSGTANLHVMDLLPHQAD